MTRYVSQTRSSPHPRAVRAVQPPGAAPTQAVTPSRTPPPPVTRRVTPAVTRRRTPPAKVSGGTGHFHPESVRSRRTLSSQERRTVRPHRTLFSPSPAPPAPARPGIDHPVHHPDPVRPVPARPPPPAPSPHPTGRRTRVPPLDPLGMCGSGASGPGGSRAAPWPCLSAPPRWPGRRCHACRAPARPCDATTPRPATGTAPRYPQAAPPPPAPA